MFYTFEEVSIEFKDVFAPKAKNINETFKKLGDKIFHLYNLLRNFEVPITFEFTEPQKKKFKKVFRIIKKDIIEHHSQGFVSNLHRGGVIAFRIAMVLTTFRNIDKINENTKKLICFKDRELPAIGL